MATDQPDTTSTVRTSTSYRSTALQINDNQLMYRALYQQICSSDQLLHTSTNIAKNLTQREKRLREKNMQNVPNQNSIVFASRRESTERRKTKKNLFCVFMRADFLLWVFYTERRKIKNNMENFRNQVHQDWSQEVLPQREKRLTEKKH